MDAGYQTAGDRRRVETAVLLDKDIVVGGFGDFAALIQEQNIVKTRCVGGVESVRVELAVGGFVEVQRVLRVDAVGANADAQGTGDRVGQGLGGDLEAAVGVEQEADLAGTPIGELSGAGLKGSDYFGAVDGESEVVG